MVMIILPVYRTYVDDRGVSDRDREILEETISLSRAALEDIEAPVWEFFEAVLIRPESCPSPNKAIAWVRRWQQFTGPLMAKGLEDTALYVHTPLTSLNEVGGEPEVLDPDALHEHNRHIAEHWPHSMLTSSTHDTKRSEDVRARIAVLSEFPSDWISYVESWMEVNAPHREEVDGVLVPDASEEQFIYQTLLGAWPLDREEFDSFRDRVKEYMTKAMREAKVHTHWIAVNEDHEKAVLRFIDRILSPDAGGRFFQELLSFQTRISSFGAWNSLSQVVLKLTSPGFPDIYQGNELWDFSLADPDNRRPVDFDVRKSYVEQAASASTDDLAQMVLQWRDGRIKMLVTNRLLASRKSQPEPFATGSYRPVTINGRYADNVIGYLRQSEDDWAITLVPRHTAGLVGPDQAPVGSEIWADTSISLPDDAPSTWVDVITGDSIQKSADGALLVGDLLRLVPVSVLRSVNS
jgi:(1->4)-alpha-D-glucan 1-alpha-D-glucosylmutase